MNIILAILLCAGEIYLFQRLDHIEQLFNSRNEYFNDDSQEKFSRFKCDTGWINSSDFTPQQAKVFLNRICPSE